MKKKRFIEVLIFIGIIIYVFINNDINRDYKKIVASAGDDKVTTTTTKKYVNTMGSNVIVSFIDVGQADSILIQDNGHNMLIDAGNNEDGPKLVTYFKSLNIESFDYVVGTHPHEDHIGGMDDIINNFEIKKYFMPDKLSTSKTFEEVLDSLASKNMKYYVPKIDDTYTLGNSTFKIIYVDSNASNDNDSSVVIKLIHDNNSFLLTGDASSSVERKILDSDIKASVLKLGHHGSQYSTSLNFLNKVDPKYAVIEVGKNNIYDHPKEVIIDRLNKKNIEIYRTDLDGTIIFESDGNSFNIKKVSTDTNGG